MLFALVLLLFEDVCVLVETGGDAQVAVADVPLGTGKEKHVGAFGVVLHVRNHFVQFLNVVWFEVD